MLKRVAEIDLGCWARRARGALPSRDGFPEISVPTTALLEFWTTHAIGSAQMGMKALVFDLDDTLLNSRKAVGELTLACLYDWIDSGRSVILATGRPVRAVRNYIPKRLFESVDLITLNGAVHHSRGDLVWRTTALEADAKRIVHDYPGDPEAHISIELDGDHFGTTVNYTDEELLVEHSATRDMVIDLARLDFDRVTKVSIDGRGKSMERHIDWIDRLGAKAIPCLDGTFLNIVAPGMDKSVTLGAHLNRHGIGRGEFAVFGDDIPDIEMMRLSEHSVAMSNAKDEVKAVADAIIGHCDADVIGTYVSSYLA